MKFSDDKYTLSSGRTFYANCGIVGIGPDHGRDEPLSEGYDGGIDVAGEFDDENGPWTPQERAELADEMIGRWQMFKESR